MKTHKKKEEWKERFKQLYEGANCEGGCISSRMCDTFIGFISTELQKQHQSIMKQVEELLEPYKVLDNLEEIQKHGLYQGPTPLSEYAYQQDLGAKKAIEDLLNKLLKK